MKTIAISCLVAIGFSVSLLAQAESDGLTVKRRELQSKFAACNAKIYPNPEKATAEAQLEFEQFGKELSAFQQTVLSFEAGLYSRWNSRSYWGDRYWQSGPGAYFLVQKLKAQMDILAALQVPSIAPFKRPDLNTTQKILDATKNCLDLDRDLELIVKNYLNQANRTTTTPSTRPKITVSN